MPSQDSPRPYFTEQGKGLPDVAEARTIPEEVRKIIIELLEKEQSLPHALKKDQQRNSFDDVTKLSVALCRTFSAELGL